MPMDISYIMNQFAVDMRRLFKDALNSVILYGSYARGDYTERSDVDVMILVSLSNDEIKAMENAVCDCAFDYFMEYGIDISPIIKNQDHFDYWVDNLPYYRNVRDEGVALNV